MIADNIKNADLYPVSDKIKKALDFLKNLKGDPKDCVFGNKGDDMYCIYSSYDEDKGKPVFEAHKKYIDVQYIVKGRELFCWKTLDVFPEDVYNAEKDCALFSEEDYGSFTLGAGDFVIFFPMDAHAPKTKNVGGSTIEKLVVKIRVD